MVESTRGANWAGILGMVLVALATSVSAPWWWELIVDRPDPVPEPTVLPEVLVRPAEIQVSASSVEEPADVNNEEIRHDPELVVDGSITTAWNDNPDFTGERWLEFVFEDPVELTKISIWSGFQRDINGRDQFTRNSRPKRIAIESGGQSQTFTLTDTRDSQTFEIGQGTPVQSVRLSILSTYEGTVFREVAISEVRFQAKG